MKLRSRGRLTVVALAATVVDVVAVRGPRPAGAREPGMSAVAIEAVQAMGANAHWTGGVWMVKG